MPEEEESEEEEPDDPRKWSKVIQDQHLTYSKDAVEPSCFGNCMSCHKVGLTNFQCCCCKRRVLPSGKSLIIFYGPDCMVNWGGGGGMLMHCIKCN